MKELETILALLDRGLTIEQVMTLAGQTVAQAVPKEPPKEPKEQPKEEPKEQPKEEPKEQPKEEPKEEPKPLTLEDLQKNFIELQKGMETLTATVQANAIQNSKMPEAHTKDVNDVIAEIIDPKGVNE